MLGRSQMDAAGHDRSNGARLWLLGLSLTLNAGLALWLLVAPPLTRSRPQAQTEPERLRPVTNTPQVANTPQPPLPAAKTGPAFRWSELESSDFRQYVRNLRAVGCPEQTIRDLVLTELNQLYAPRANAIWQRPKEQYWQKQRDESPGPDQIKQLTALAREKSAVMKDLFGQAPTPQELVDTAFLQIQGDEQRLLFLPESTRQAALQALEESGLNEKEASMLAVNRNSDPERTLFDEKLKVLEAVLSPEELKEFRLRSAPRAQWLRTEVQYFDCTPDEFAALLDLREKRLGASENLAVDRATALEDVRKLFGDARAREFDRVSDLNYLNARYAADRAGLSDELGDRAGQLTADTVAAAMRLANDQALTPEERQRRTEALQTEVDTRLKEMVGDKAAFAIKRVLQQGLRMGSIHP